MGKALFGFEKPEDSSGFLLWQTTISWQRLIKRALAPYGISHSQFVIMAILLWFEKHDYDTIQTEIVNWSKMDKMTVSKSLKKLALQGFVYRVEHDVDTRAKRSMLTEKGKNLVSKLIPVIEGIDVNFFGVLGEEKGRALVQILGKLVG